MEEKEPAASTLTASEEPKKPRKNFLKWLFDPGTRLGRFNRAALRGLAVVLGLFALGLACGYILLYRPVRVELNQVHIDLQAAQEQVDKAATQASAQSSTVSDLTAQSSKLQVALDQANEHIQLLQLLDQFRLANLSLVTQDPDNARKILLTARTDMLQISAVLDRRQPDQTKAMQTRLDLILAELNSSPKTAISDLQILVQKLLEIEKAYGLP